MDVAWLLLVLGSLGSGYDSSKHCFFEALQTDEYQTAIERFAAFEIAVREGTMPPEELEQRITEYNWSVGRPADAAIENESIDAVISTLEAIVEGDEQNQIILERIRAYCRVMECRHVRAYSELEVREAFHSFQEAIKDGRMNVDELDARAIVFNWSLGRLSDANVIDLSFEESRRLLNQIGEFVSEELAAQRHDAFCRSIGLAIPK